MAKQKHLQNSDDLNNLKELHDNVTNMREYYDESNDIMRKINCELQQVEGRMEINQVLQQNIKDHLEYISELVEE